MSKARDTEKPGSDAGPSDGAGSTKVESKRQKREARRRAARQKALRGKILRWSLLSLIIVVPALWGFDRSGAEEVAEAVVIQTQEYKHFNEQSGIHTHKRATILVDGSSEQTIERADSYQRGQRVQVWVRKGRITGWPYYNDVVKPGEIQSDSPAGTDTESASM